MNLYVNHFPKHEKYALAQEIRRAAYDVYALIVEAQKRYQKKTTLIKRMGLEPSKFTLARTTRGINFVGYRTWASRRFVRRRALFVARRAIRQSDAQALASSLGHARRTHSLQHLLNLIKEHDHAHALPLSEAYHPGNHARDQSSNRRDAAHGAGDRYGRRDYLCQLD